MSALCIDVVAGRFRSLACSPVACLAALLSGSLLIATPLAAAAHRSDQTPVRSWQERIWAGVWPSPGEEGCGWAAWQTFAAALGLPTDQVDAAVNTAPAPLPRATLADLYDLSQRAALPVLPFRFSTEGLRQYLAEQDQPILLQLVRPERHFVVAVPWQVDRCLVADPARGWTVQSLETLAVCTNGAALVGTAEVTRPSPEWQEGVQAFAGWAQRWGEALSSSPFRWNVGLRTRIAQRRWQGVVPDPQQPGRWLPVEMDQERERVSLVGSVIWESDSGWWGQLAGESPLWERQSQLGRSWVGEMPVQETSVLGVGQVGWRVGYRWPVPTNERRWEVSGGGLYRVGAGLGERALSGQWDLQLGLAQLDEPAIWRVAVNAAWTESGLAGWSGSGDLELVVTPRLAVGLHGVWAWDAVPFRGRASAGVRFAWCRAGGWAQTLQVGVGDGLQVELGWQGARRSAPPHPG